MWWVLCAVLLLQVSGAAATQLVALDDYTVVGGGEARRVAAKDKDIYYIARYSQGLDVISYPATWIQNIPAFAGAAYYLGGRLYVAGGEVKTLTIYAADGPIVTTPPLLSIEHGKARCFRVYAFADTAVLYCEGTGAVYFLSNLFATPQAVQMSTFAQAKVCAFDEARGFVYVAVNSGIKIMNLNTVQPTSEPTIVTQGSSCATYGEYVYVSSNVGVLETYHFPGSGSTPTLVQSTPSPSNMWFQWIVFMGSMGLARATFGDEFLTLYDFSNPTAPVAREQINIGRRVWTGVAMQKAFVIAATDHVAVYEVGNNAPTPPPVTQTPGSVLEKWGSGFDSFSRGIAADTATKMYYVSSDSRGLLAVRFDHSAGTGQMNEVVAFEAATSEGVCLSSSGTRLYSFGDNTFSVKDVSDIYNTKTFTTMSSTNYNTVNNCSESVYNRGAVYAMCNITNGEGDFPSLALFNASDEGPQYKSTMRSGGGFCMDTERNLLFVVSRGFGSQVKPGDSITAYDVSDPFVLTPAFTVESPGEAVVRCAVQGKYLFLGGASGMLQVVDVSQAVPVRVDQGTCCSPNLHSIRTFAFIGHYGLSHDNLGEVAAIDLTDVTQPRIVHSIDMSHVGLGQSQVMDQYWLVVSETGVIPFRVDLPPTPAPPTGVPPTAAPLTPYPPTLSPPTPHPQTDAPPTAAPLTPHPPTDVPATTPPRTPSPPTDVPKTTPPLTLPPPTGVPDSISPGTTSPPTLFPATQAPVTTSPLTQPPLSQPPLTQSPPTPAPAFELVTAPPLPAAPRTDVPETSNTAAPFTSQPSVLIEVTPTPASSPKLVTSTPTMSPETAVPKVASTVQPEARTSVPPTLSPLRAIPTAPPYPSRRSHSNEHNEVTPAPSQTPTSSPAAPTAAPTGNTFIRWCENDATCEVHGDIAAKCIDDKCACSQEKYNSLEGVNVCIAAPAGDVRSYVLVVARWDADCAKYDTKFDGYIISTLERELGGVAKGKERQCNEAVGVRLAIVMAGAETQKVAEVGVGQLLESMYKLDERVNDMTYLGPVVSSMIIVSRSCDTEGSEVGLIDESGNCHAYACLPTYTLTAGVCSVPSSDDGTETFSAKVVLIIIAVLVCLLAVAVFILCMRRADVPKDNTDALMRLVENSLTPSEHELTTVGSPVERRPPPLQTPRVSESGKRVRKSSSDNASTPVAKSSGTGKHVHYETPLITNIESYYEPMKVFLTDTDTDSVVHTPLN